MQNRKSLPLPANLDDDPDHNPARLIGLSDGIYAFAMTLLAINVDFPTLVKEATSAKVNDAVLELLPQVFIYVTSFLLVALYWQNHRRTFYFIKRSDEMLTWLNLLQLMFVAFLPVATGLFDTYINSSLVILIYAGTLAVIGVLGLLLWRHVRRAHLVDENADPVLLDYYSFRGTVTLSIYLLVMVVGVIEPPLARYVFLLFLFVYPFLSRIYRVLYPILPRS
jgi:TMEM175 potassium channel family protein